MNHFFHFCRMNPLAPLMKLQLFQHIYFFFLLALYGFSVVVTAIGEYGRHYVYIDKGSPNRFGEEQCEPRHKTDSILHR